MASSALTRLAFVPITTPSAGPGCRRCTPRGNTTGALLALRVFGVLMNNTGLTGGFW
ncbi:hypothetical protein D3C80_2035860 [compost metagenome]